MPTAIRVALKLTEGQAHDGKSMTDLLKRLGAGQTLLADRAYDSDALRESLAQRGAWANIKPMPGHVNIPAFSAFLYRYRNASSSGSSINSSITEPSPRASKNTTPTISPSSNSPRPKSGCGL